MSKWESADTLGKVQLIKEVWKPGIRARQLAVEVSRIAGETVTKHSIISLYFRCRRKAERDGTPNPLANHPLPQSPRKKKRNWAQAPKSKTLKQKIEERRVLLAEIKEDDEYVDDGIPSLHVPLVDLKSRHCRWPTKKEGGVWFFCGLDSKPGHSYCTGHYDMSTRDFDLKLTALPEKVAM